MDDGMVVGSTVVPQYLHNGAPRDSSDRGRCANLCFRCRRKCSNGEYGADEIRSCSAGVCRSVCSKIMLILVNLAFLADLSLVCWKSMLIFVNLAFVLAGWTLIGLGLWIHIFHDTLPYNILFRDNATGPLLVLDRLPIMLVITGGTISVIGFLGCCGACTESVCFLGFYAVLLVLSFVAQVTVATLAITFHNQIRVSTIVSLQFQIQEEYNITAKYSNMTESETYKITLAWDRLQTQFNCCGAVGPQDYHDSMWSNNTDHTHGPFVPQSCCRALRHPYDSTQCQIKAAEYVSDLTEHHHNKHKLTQQYDRDITADDASSEKSGGRVVESGHDDQPGERVQGCHSAIVNWVSAYTPFIFVLLAVDLLQVMNVLCACLLIGMVRRKQVDYSWCEDQDEVD